ncbi:MAG: ABC-F family ATP-binding cassette domain-containing protein [Burkholderiales bacterium]|nr:ABC-F family ATP-binding cassette domain-containing protein [Phycisphaerae bacterium]
MPLIQLNNIEKILGDRLIFDKLVLSIEKGERVGLIGNNGEGKTTLFRTIVGEITPDVGEVGIPRGTKVGYLKQDATFDAGNTLIDEAELAFSEMHDMSHKLREIEHGMADAQGEALDKLLARYEKLQHQFDESGGYAWSHRLEATLLGVGLGRDVWETNVEKLSGGQRSRLALAKLLIAEPDLLLLDEPTNHLDLEAIEWLEEYLLAFNGAMLLISHDRYLLDRLTTRIVWLTQRRLKSYPGNFSAFLEQKALEELSQKRAYELQQKDIAKQQEFIRRFSAGQRAREAQGRAKKLNRLLKSDAVIDSVQSRKSMHVRFSNDARAGDQLLRVKELTKSFDDRVIWKDIAFNVKPGERIGIIGPNGSGKTTLLKILIGELDADDGEIRWGTNLNIGYYDQRLDEFDPDNTILEEVHDGIIPERKARDMLGSLLFSGDDVDKRMGDLSGGERARVALAELMLENPNVILLDEPTNHLDLQSADALERTLSNYDGTLLIVSHDRYFLQKIATRMLIIDPPSMIDFEGTFKEWHDKLAEDRKKPDQKKPDQKKNGSKNEPKKQAAMSSPAPVHKNPVQVKPNQKKDGQKKDNPYARPFGRFSVGEIEAQIAATEKEIASAQESLAQSFRDAGKSKKLQQVLDQQTDKLKQLEQEYFLRET